MMRTDQEVLSDLLTCMQTEDGERVKEIALELRSDLLQVGFAPFQAGPILNCSSTGGGPSTRCVAGFTPFAKSFLAMGLFKVTWLFSEAGFEVLVFAYPN